MILETNDSKQILIQLYDSDEQPVVGLKTRQNAATKAINCKQYPVELYVLPSYTFLSIYQS